MESLVTPGARIAPGYGLTTVTFANGTSLTGSILAESPETIDLQTDSDLWRIAKKDIHTRQNPPSAMPPMATLLTREEIRDVAAWLTTLNTETESPVLLPKPFEISGPSLRPPSASALPTPYERPRDRSFRFPWNAFGALAVLGWIALCFLPILVNLKNR